MFKKTFISSSISAFIYAELKEKINDAGSTNLSFSTHNQLKFGEMLYNELPFNNHVSKDFI
jgi:hypothetical protein